MKQKIMQDIKSEYYQKNYANDGQRFIAWYLRNIFNLNTVEAKDCITDGAGDKQIDAVYIDNQDSIIYIIQGKYYSGTIDSEPLQEVLASWVQINNLKALQEHANEKLRAKINDISNAIEDDYTICFELVTTGNLTPAAKNDFEVFQKTLSSYEGLTANFTLVDLEVLQFRYDEAMNKSRPYINYEFRIQPNKYVELDLDGTKAVIAAIPLKECIKIPGIRDGSLFRKNVRQSLGNNKINKGIAKTIKNDPKEFFFYHNGITAICSRFEIVDNVLKAKELNVVNGCQSLNTIYSCSESIKSTDDGYIMFKFYEIADSDKADRISVNTNSQSAVKARDLRSNDKNVLAIKKAYEERYPDGYFKTKRGEEVNTVKYNTNYIVDLTDLGKELIAWHSQRPTISYSETKIFDKYFTQLFHKEYQPENIQSLKELFDAVKLRWNENNPLNINEQLLAMKSYATYHHLYTISYIFCVINNMPELVPNPTTVLNLLKENDLLDKVVNLAGNCLNMAFENANIEAGDNGKIFSPQNWSKNKGSLKNIKEAVRNQMSALTYIPEGKKLMDDLCKMLEMSRDKFENRWTAD